MAELRGGLTHAGGCRVVKEARSACVCSVRVWQCWEAKSFLFFFRNQSGPRQIFGNEKRLAREFSRSPEKAKATSD